MSQIQDSLAFLFERRSIRSFTPQPLTESEINQLIQAALASPSAINNQSWRFHFITNPEVINAINDATMDQFASNGQTDMLDRLTSRRATSIFYGAPLVVVISSDRRELEHYALVNAGIATENIALAAQALGLGSCIIGMAAPAFEGPRRQELSARIELPDSHDFTIAVAIGHPAKTKDAHQVLPNRIVRID